MSRPKTIPSAPWSTTCEIWRSIDVSGAFLPLHTRRRVPAATSITIAYSCVTSVASALTTSARVRPLDEREWSSVPGSPSLWQPPAGQGRMGSIIKRYPARIAGSSWNLGDGPGVALSVDPSQSPRGTLTSSVVLPERAHVLGVADRHPVQHHHRQPHVVQPARHLLPRARSLCARPTSPKPTLRPTAALGFEVSADRLADASEPRVETRASIRAITALAGA
jgi:hypothetical protein